jgi:hypothetical protein
MLVQNLNIRDFTYVLANIRHEDECELRAIVDPNSTFEQLCTLLQACFTGLAYSVWYDQRPIAVFGAAISSSPSLYHAWAFGTDDFYKAVPTITRFMWEQVSHTLYTNGALRVEARALAENIKARKWLKKIGFNEDCKLNTYGSKGEDFYLYSMTVADYRKKFGIELH